MNHCMLDLETLGQGPYAVILSCGVVAFSKQEIMSSKEWFLNVEQQTQQGRKIDWSTLQWWGKQSEDARQIFQNSSQTNLIYFCNELFQFFNMYCKAGKVWGNGASFDIPILETLIKKNMNVDPPWKFWDHRCYRTVKALFSIEKDVAFEGVRHGALPDALHQAKCLQKLFQERPELEK